MLPILDYNPLDDLPIPGGSPLASGYLIYWPAIQNLAGGNTATDLNAQDISYLPNNTLIEVVIANRGASQWLRVQDATSPATDLNAGIIVPTVYNSSTKPWILKRQLGF